MSLRLRKDSVVYYTRWTDRPITKHFSTAILKELSLWEKSGYELRIAVHGKAEDDEATRTFGSHFPERVLRHGSEFSMSEIFRDIFYRVLDSNFRFMAFLDDDARIAKPSLCYERMKATFELPRVGQTGPHDAYSSFIHHNNERDPFWHYTKPLRTTIGCQMYSRDAIADTEEFWSPYHKKKLVAIDDISNTLFMELKGWKSVEFYLPGYSHKVSLLAENVLDEAWYARILRAHYADCLSLLKILQKAEVTEDFYAERKVAILKLLYNMKFRARFLKKRGVDFSEWAVPVASTKIELGKTLEFLGLDPRKVDL